ncbi:MAG: hypothetical protein MZV49_00345 [Rhodopseudomonas palustris]|nr:hypothetical protein [Rhodopseudomonas palustris]
MNPLVRPERHLRQRHGAARESVGFISQSGALLHRGPRLELQGERSASRAFVSHRLDARCWSLVSQLPG